MGHVSILQLQGRWQEGGLGVSQRRCVTLAMPQPLWSGPSVPAGPLA